MNDDLDAIVDRLRRLGAEPPPEGMFDHRVAMLLSDDEPAHRRRGGWLTAAALTAIVPLVAGVLWAINATSDGPRPAVRTPATGPSVASTSAPVAPVTTVRTVVPDPTHPPDEVPLDPFPDDPCKGPPPFAGRDPVRTGDRQADSDEWERMKDACPDDSDEERSVPGTEAGVPP
jgi:hypothetical protein